MALSIPTGKNGKEEKPTGSRANKMFFWGPEITIR